MVRCMESLSEKQSKITFDVIYETYFDRVYKYAFTLLLNKEDAEDVTSETFCAALKNFRQIWYCAFMQSSHRKNVNSLICGM